jgi:hypothetical protein
MKMKYVGLAALALAATLALVPARAQKSLDSFYQPYPTADDGGGKYSEYTVKEGETLFDIAEKLLGDPYRASVLAKLNDIKDPLRLKAGDTIKVPRPRLGILYSFEMMTEECGLKEVSEKYVFRSGDRFHLRVTANSDGYLYVFNRSAGGDIDRLLPRKISQPMRIHRFSEYMLPREGWFRLDKAKGPEEIFVMVSSEPLTDLDSALLAENGVRPGKENADALEHYADNHGKGIEVDAGGDEEAAGTVVTSSPLEGTPVLVHRIQMKHR